MEPKSNPSASPAEPGKAASPTLPEPPPAAQAKADISRAYWSATLKLLGTILVVWFAVSCIASILLVDVLNQYSLWGYPLGFWFAQQGAMYVFVVLIFIYTRQMGRIDRRFDVHEE